MAPVVAIAAKKLNLIKLFFRSLTLFRNLKLSQALSAELVGDTSDEANDKRASLTLTWPAH